MIDASKGVPVSTLDKMKGFIASQGRMFNISNNVVKVSILSFGSKSKMILPINQGKSMTALRLALEKVAPTEEERHVEKALEAIKEYILRKKDGLRESAGKVVVLLVSGRNSPSGINKMKSEAQELRNAGVELAVVGIGSSLDKNHLKSVATSPEKFVQVASDDELPVASPVISKSIKSAALVSPKVDLGFVFGADGPNAANDFALGRKLIIEILKKLQLSPDKSRFGLVLYGRHAAVLIRLDTFDDRNRAIKLIEELRLPSLGFALAKALEFTRSNLFSASYGARKDVPKTVIVLLNKKPDLESILAAGKLIKDGVKVKAIALGKTLDVAPLKGFTSTNEDALKISSEEDMQKIAEKALSTLLPGKLLEISIISCSSFFCSLTRYQLMQLRLIEFPSTGLTSQTSLLWHFHAKIQ